MQARLHLSLAELDALHGRPGRQLIRLQATLPLWLAARTAERQVRVQGAPNTPARRGQHRPGADLRQAGLHAATQRGQLCPFPAVFLPTQLALQLGLGLAHLGTVPVQLGHELLVLHPHQHLGLAQTCRRALAGCAVGFDAQIALAALSGHARVQVLVHTPLRLALERDVVQQVGAQPSLRPRSGQV